MPCMKDAHNPLKRGNKESMKQQALTLSVLATYIVFFLKLTNYLTDNAEFPQNDKPLRQYVTIYMLYAIYTSPNLTLTPP